MRWFIAADAGEVELGLFGKGAAFVLRGLAKFTGVEFLEHVGEFVTDINELFGGFRERAKAVYEDLRGPDVAFVIVTSPSPLAVGEATFFSKKLSEYGIVPRAVVVNRVQRAADARRRARRAALAARSAAPARRRRAARAHAATPRAIKPRIAARDREGIRRLREHIGPSMTYTEVPALERDVHDLASLAEIAALSAGPSAPPDYGARSRMADPIHRSSSRSSWPPARARA